MAERIPEVAGFRFAALAAGIKKTGLPDLALAVSEQPVPCAAVFTTNLVQAAPVKIARERVARGRAQAVLVNSGNANACTGRAGREAALAASGAVASALAIEPELVVPASTRVIGELLAADRICAAAAPLVGLLDPRAASEFSRAIMTTDKAPKLAARRVRVGGAEGTVLGIAKGAGMIHPHMATTLAFVFTDLSLSPEQLDGALRRAIDHSFNIATVDGETSTNDMVLVMASGAAQRPTRGQDSASERFEQPLREVLRELAEQIVADGEGAEHMAEVQVRGMASDTAARAIAERVARSLLVKTAMHGKDANWGRILSAAGMAGVPFDPEVAAIFIDDVAIVRAGLGLGQEAEAAAQRIMARSRYQIRLELGAGPGEGSYLTCDLGHRYVDVNAGYRS